MRVDLRNAGERRLRSVWVSGELIGGRARASLGDLDPGHAASAVLTFPYDHEWRPGRHVLPLSIRYEEDAAPPPSRRDVRAYLIVQLATPTGPALKVTAADTTLDLRARLRVRVESVDGEPHRVRVRVETPRGLQAPDPPPVVEVPARGSREVDIPLLYGDAPRDTRQGVLVVAQTLDGHLERMALATATVAVAPDPAWLPRLRAPLAVVALVLVAAGLVAEWRSVRP